jgi:hypothetical protein
MVICVGLDIVVCMVWTYVLTCLSCFVIVGGVARVRFRIVSVFWLS